MHDFAGVDCDTDIDECTVNPDVCGDANKICTNTVGSYTCTCRSGYTLSDSGTCDGKYHGLDISGVPINLSSA